MMQDVSAETGRAAELGHAVVDPRTESLDFGWFGSSRFAILGKESP